MSVDWLTNPSHAKAVQSVMLDVGGEKMYGMIAISDWDEEITDIAFIFLIPLWSSLLLVPICESFVIVCLPVFVGFFKVSCICLMLCQSFSSLPEYLQLFMVAAIYLLILLCNSCQSLGDVEELFLARGAVSFESSAYGSGGELQLTEFFRGCHNLQGN